MARTVLTSVAVATPSPTPVENALNAIFAAIPSAIIKAFELVLTDQSPVTSRAVRTVIDTESGGALLADQYRARVFIAEDESDLADQINDFTSAQPTWFYAPVVYLYSDQIQGEGRRSMAVVVYTSDAVNGAANWQAGGSGGGSAASGTMVGTPSVEVAFDSASPIAIVTPPESALIRRVSVIVDTTFDAVGATLAVGVAGTPSRYMTTAQNMLDVAAIFNVEPFYQEDGTPEPIIATFVPGAGGTQGSARVTIEYSLP